MTSEERYSELADPAASTVLIVEDEILIRMTLAAALRDEGFTVIETCDADEALAVLAMTSIDLLVTDVRMEGSMDGIDLAVQVKSKQPDLKIIVVSGHFPAYETQGVADAFVAKPYLAENLTERIKAILSHTDVTHAL